MMPVISGLAAVAGHSWSPFLRFKGGKGVATSAGVFLGLAPWAGIVAIAVFLGVFLWTRTVSIGSLSAAVVLPTASFIIYGTAPVSWLALVVAILVVVRHVPNIRRLLKGEELAFGKKP
jgi:glycerol-3-phosphate acyltransferase PlsY